MSNSQEEVNHAEAQAVSQSQRAINRKDHAVRNSQSLAVVVKQKRAAVINPQEDKKEEQAVPVPAFLVKVEKAAVTVKEHEKEKATEILEDDQIQGADLKKRPRKKKLDAILHQEEITEEKGKAVDGDDEVSKNKMLQSQEVHKVKLEKVQENSAARPKCKLNKENEIHAFKRGMEVSLRSPDNLELVASATVSNVDDKEIGLDYVEVMVNYVMKKSTMLPRAQGRIKNMSSAQASRILWPRVHINIVTQSEIVHQKI
ncbi:hypothetical protein ACQ4PT_031561 [Festuca glaucescens]